MGGAEGPYFSADLFRFLRELEKNNRREWFQDQKPRFEAVVLEPSVRFVGAMGPRLAKISRHVVADARPYGGSVSRIYRDTRFSKDKSPYRTHVGIHFGHDAGSESEAHLPGFYLHLAPGESMVASGIWHPDPEALRHIRTAIVSKGPAWRKVLRASPPSGGESSVRPPPGFPSDHEFVEDLKRKDFFTSVTFRDSEVTAPSFGESFLRACVRIDPLNQFLANAIGVPW